MSRCKNCQAEIPKYADTPYGRKRLRRMYCLECVPYRTTTDGNSHPFYLPAGDQNKICEVCKNEYIYNRSKSTGATTKYCNTCHSKIRRKKEKERCVKNMGVCCQICGYKKCNKSLHFHHLDPKTKKSKRSSIGRLSREEVDKELESTILLCSNCHSELHDGMFCLLIGVTNENL